MSTPAATAKAPSFAVISGAEVHEVIDGHEAQVTRVIESAYRIHGRGGTVNPDSYFLRFPDRPSSRIIALPASVRGDVDVHGIKWVSSFPENIDTGLPRASAVIILNDLNNGYPFACLEASIISAARTGASAALAAKQLSDRRGVRPRRLGFVGAGLIARYIYRYLIANELEFDTIGIHDLDPRHADGLAAAIGGADRPPVTRYETAAELLRASDLVVFATVAGQPYIDDPSLLAHCPLVLHVSLRDLAPEVILAGYNVVDDVEHCLKAQTSVHLTEQRTGGRSFIAGTLYQVLADELKIPADRPVIFSPFGLGVLDLALARHVYDTVAGSGGLSTVPGFFFDLHRHNPASGQTNR